MRVVKSKRLCLRVLGVLRKAVVLAALAAVLLPQGAASARSSEVLVPGIRHVRETRMVGGAPVVFHLVYAPKPGGLYGLRPVLSNNTVSGRETLSAMQRRLLHRANVVGVNADFFTWETGHPNGIYVQHGALSSHPLADRSSLGIGLDGMLRIARLRFAGSFQVAGRNTRVLREYNRPLRAIRGFTLFTSAWGARAPVRPRTHEAILVNVRRIFPNTDRVGSVLKIVRGSGHAIPPGGAILQARGTSRPVLRADAAPGASITFHLGLAGWWDGVKAAIGGGPLLVRGGVPVLYAGEAFTRTQLGPRSPRTAVGQLADGRILFVAVDGRSHASRGLTNVQLARAMVHYGAVEAMAFDSGGSTELAFNGRVLNRPSDGYERPIADSFQLTYIGVYAPKPRRPSFSPNGDGYADTQVLAAKLVRRSAVDIRLYRPDGTVQWQLQGTRDPGLLKKRLASSTLQEGVWRWIATAVDSQGRSSRMERRFSLNKTLGYVTVSKSLMRVRRGTGGHLRVGFRLAHTADVKVTISRRGGSLVRTIAAQADLRPGGYAAIWNGRDASGRVVRSGRFVVTVQAKNVLGRVAQAKGFVVRRVR
jgi:Phosphodiester glycosidase/FlgD Ig-like domain